MAEYFTSFSCTFDTGSAANALKACRLAKACQRLLIKREGGGITFEVDHHPEPFEPPGLIWIHDEGGYGDPDEVIPFVLRCARRFSLAGHWGFAWSFSCSRPRLDSFGGGACLLDLGTGCVTAEIDCIDWLDTELRKTRRFFIHSKAEATRDDRSGWWSNESGWGRPEKATIYTHDERHAFDQALLSDDEISWHELLPGSTVAASTRNATDA